MDASKVTIAKQTLHNSLLSQKDRIRLRRERVVEYIRSVPAGTPIKPVDIMRHAGIDLSSATRTAFFNSMVRDGIITKEPVFGTHKFTFTVVGDAKTIVPPKPKEEPVVEEADKPADEVAVRSDTTTLESLAKEFAWKNNSDSLREFVEWMDGKELEALRVLFQGRIK
jgi:hypothetical protein